MRFVEYLQYPATKELETRMFDELGLSDRDRAIALSFSKHTGDMEFYADLAGIPRKKFVSICAGIFRRMMAELIRLAELGLRYEAERKK